MRNISLILLGVSCISLLSGCGKDKNQYADHPISYQSKTCETIKKAKAKAFELFDVRRMYACLNESSEYKHTKKDENGKEIKFEDRFVVEAVAGKRIRLEFTQKFRKLVSSLNKEVAKEMGVTADDSFIDNTKISYSIQGVTQLQQNEPLEFIELVFDNVGEYKDININWHYEGGSTVKKPMSKVMPLEFKVVDGPKK